MDGLYNRRLLPALKEKCKGKNKAEQAGAFS
jgi:hypothetical protein